LIKTHPRQNIASNVLLRAEKSAERFQIVQCQFDILFGAVSAIALIVETLAQL
jgi:hypothetical protein